MSQATENTASPRFRWAGPILLASVLAGLGALAVFRLRVVAPERPRAGYVVKVTHGPKDPDRVLLALVTATKLPNGDNHVWFAIDGGQLCKKGAAEKVSSPLFAKQVNAAKVIEELRARGISVHI
jgi:hypothetical protein